MTHKEFLEGPFTAKDFKKLGSLPASFPLSWDAIAEVANAKFHKLLGRRGMGCIPCWNILIVLIKK